MIPEDWTEAGYHRWETYRSQVHRLADFGLQKRFDDENGVRYFITVYVYDRSEYPYHDESNRWGFMPTVQFLLGDGLPFYNIDINGTFDINLVEREVERLWTYFNKPYYNLREKNDE